MTKDEKLDLLKKIQLSYENRNSSAFICKHIMLVTKCDVKETWGILTELGLDKTWLEMGHNINSTFVPTFECYEYSPPEKLKCIELTIEKLKNSNE